MHTDNAAAPRTHIMLGVYPMHRLITVVLAVLLALGTWAVALAQDEEQEEEVKINLVAENQPVKDVAAEITEQSGIQVAVTENTNKDLNGTLEDKTVEEAVRLLGQGANATWLRAYIIEMAPPDLPYTAAELREKLDLVRTSFWEGMSDEERQAVYARWRERLMPPEEEQAGAAAGGPGGQQVGPGGMQGRGRGGMFGFGDQEMPGGGVADMRQLVEQPGPEGQPDPAAEGGPGGPGGRGGFGGFMRYEDDLRGLLMPARFDTISLALEEVSLADAVEAFTAESGFLVIVEDDLDGVVTLQLEEEQPEEAVAAMAEAAGAQWRPFYLLGQPRELTEPEVAQRQQDFEQRQQQFAQRREQRFAQMWGEFWQMNPQDRAQRIEQMTERIESIPPERMQRAQRRMSRMLPRITDYASTLTPEQRLELKPLLQAMARVAGQ